MVLATLWGLGAGGVAAAGPSQARTDSGGSRPASAELAGAPAYYEVPDGTEGKVAGAALSNVEPDSLPELASALQRLRSDGLNSVSLYVWWEAPAADADGVSPYAGTVSDAELGDEISLARSQGLAISLSPVFWCDGCQGGFRGVIHPAHLPAFFASYGSFVDHYATLAQADGVSTFFVGSEMSSLEAATRSWRSLIAGVRRLYHGRVAYEENWDVLGNARFLGAVDLIGVSAYFPLDAGPSPSLAQLLADWRSSRVPGWRGRDWVSAVAQLSAAYHRPILFGEVGYMSGQYAGRQPYLNYYSTPDEALQAGLYQALLETFEAYPWWAGVNWFDWEVVPDGPALNGRTFQAKAAETTLQDWYGRGVRPRDPDTPVG